MTKMSIYHQGIVYIVYIKQKLRLIIRSDLMKKKKIIIIVAASQKTFTFYTLFGFYYIL